MCIAALIGAIVGTFLISPVAALYLAPALTLSATADGEALFTAVLLGTCLLAGSALGACVGAAFGCAVTADRRNGGFACRGER